MDRSLVRSKLYSRSDPEWKAKRALFVTATDMGSLFGLNKYSSPAKVIESKKNPTFIDNEFTRMGRILEPAVAEAVSEAISEEVKFFGHRDSNLIYFNEETLISATPDAYIGLGTSQVDTVVELKSTSPNNIRKWVKEPPLHYFMQLATQSLLLGKSKGMLGIMAAEYPTMPVLVFDFTTTDLMINLIESEVTRFWSDTHDGKLFRINSTHKKAITEELLKNISVNTVIGIEIEEKKPIFIEWGGS